MARTKIPVEFSSTPGIVDNSSATAITIDSAGAATFSGTVTADGLVVNTGSYGAVEAGSGRMYGSTTHGLVIQGNGTTNNFLFLGSDGSDSFKIANNGDISFYEDTGTSPKLTWSASAESLGIGTSSPQAKLDVSDVGNFSTGYGTFTGDGLHIQCNGTGGAGAFTGGISFSRISADNNSRAAGIAGVQGADADQVGLAFFTHPSATTTDSLVEAMRIDSSGNVGIGVVPSNTFSVGASGTVTTRYTSTDTGAFSLLQFENNGSIVLSADHGNAGANSAIIFKRDGAQEAMRIDASGALVLNNAGGDAQMYFGGTGGTNRMYLARSGADSLLWNVSNGTMKFGTNNTERMRIDSSGRVGIGTENPATALHVGGDITVGSAESVGTGAAAAIRFVNDNERARITSNYASGGGGQMGFWTDSTGGTLVQRAYIKNNGEVNLQAGLRLNGYNYGNSDVFKTYHIDGPGSSTTTRTININTYFGFTNGTGGYFMMSLHGWQTDSAAGLIHWHNGGSGGPMTSAYFEPFYTPTGLTVSVAKGTGDYDIDITLTGTHTNTHGWRMNVWG